MPRRRITFRQLETFAAVARLSSFTKAGEFLHLTQPAVSIQIRQIVEAIGLPLFEQSGRDVALTAAGQELLLTVRRLDDIWNRFESEISGLKGLKRGKLRIGLEMTSKYFLPRMLGAFCQRYPEIGIELEIANRGRIVDRLRGNEDDLYVMSYPPEDMDIVTQPILDNEYVVIAPIGHWAVGKTLALAELAGEPFLLREIGSGSRHVIDDYIKNLGIKLNIRLSLASNEAIRELVSNGMGLGVLSRHVLGDSSQRDGITILCVDGLPLKQPWSVVYLRSKVLSLPARAFLDELTQSKHETA